MGEGQVRVWCLLGRKAGDNTQVLALANQLGWAFEEKTISARPWELLVHLGHRATLAGIDEAASSTLAPPWPDVVISAGRRNEPVAQWIRRQSGGLTRLVHMGRPWAPLEQWDLVVTTPQYFLPRQANILHNRLPLHRPDPVALAAAAGIWQPRFEALPRPWIALLVGGDSGPFVFTSDKGQRLGGLANALAARSGGSLLLTDSPRTPTEAMDALVGELAVPHHCHRFADGGDNPYQGLLALADAFVVTGESMSMLGEAADTGRPLFIFDPGDGKMPWWRLAHNWRYKPLSFHLGMALGPARMRRDIGRIQSALVASGAAAWLDASVEAVVTADRQPGATGSAALEELERTADAVRRLVILR